MLGVKLTKYQQRHSDVAPAAHQMFTSLLTYLLEPYSTFKCQPIHMNVNSCGRSKWLSAVTRLTVPFVCGLMSD